MSNKTKNKDAQDYERSCNEGAQRILRLPGDIGVNRVERRLGSSMRRGGRNSDGVEFPADYFLYGINNFSVLNYLMTPNPGGEAGTTTGFGVVQLVRFDSLTGVSQVPSSRGAASSGGWFFNIDASSNLKFSAKSTAAFPASPLRALSPTDLGRVHCVIGLHTGASGLVRLLVDRAEIGAGTATTDYLTTAAATGMGVLTSVAQPANGCTILAESSFWGIPSTSQLQDYFDAVRLTGDLPPTIGGATVTHRWSMKDELRTLPDFTGRQTFSVRGFNGSSAFGTAASTSSGYLGATTGFFAQARVRLDSVATGSRYYVNRCNFSTMGYSVDCAGTTIRAQAGNGSAIVSSPLYTMLSTDQGRTVVITMVWDQPSQLLRLYIDGVQVGTGTTMTAYSPFNTSDSTFVGRFRAGWASDPNHTISDVACGDVVPTAATLLLQAQASADAGRLIPLTGTTRRWDVTADTVVATTVPSTLNEKVSGASGDALLIMGTGLELTVETAKAPVCPSQLTDRITAASTDALVRVGNPSIVKIDPTIDGRRTLGVQGYTLGSYFSAATGIRGSASGFSVSMLVRPDVTPTSGHHLLGVYNSGATAGYSIVEVAGGYRVDAINGGGGFAASRALWTLTAADLGKMALITVVYTGTVWRMFVNGVQQGTDIADTFTPNTVGPMNVGKDSYTALAPYDSSIFGVCGGSGANKVPTFIEIQQQYADFLSTGRIVGIPGKVDSLWDFTADILASGVDSVPTTILDRVGSDNLTRQGIDVRTNANSIRGIGPFCASDAFVSLPGGGVAGAAAGFHIALDIWFTKIPTAASSFVTMPRNVTTAGFRIDSNTGGFIRFVLLIGGSVKSSAVYTVTSADIGRR
ncbi:MAG: hypothetical protein JWO15_3695, partial [Sphingomonadales bacterium]|nr:hypothetical protein [Sphingomonadales bacterium]